MGRPRKTAEKPSERSRAADLRRAQSTQALESPGRESVRPQMDENVTVADSTGGKGQVKIPERK